MRINPANNAPTILRIACIALLLSSCASSKIKITNIPLTQHLNSNPAFRESHTGLLVYDIAEEEVLFDYNSHKHFIPASNAKLLTFFATLNMLKESIPSIEYCTINDTLYFTGTGDPTLLYKGFGYSKTFDFLKNRNERLVYVSKPIVDSRLGSGWSWDDYPYYFSAEKSSFPIYGNMVYFSNEPSSDYIKVRPDLFEDHLSILHDANIEDYSIDRKEFSNTFRIKFGDVPLEFNEEMPFIYSDQLFAELLSDTLNKDVLVARNFPQCETSMLFSTPTDSISKQILLQSDNFLAEQMLLVMSNQIGDTLNSKRTIEYTLDNFLIDISKEINWVDGSGLSRYNQVTPYSMVSLLKKIYGEVSEERLFDLLSESGTSGKLKNSFLGLSGKIHGKSGSMSHVYNLSGFLKTNSDKTLVFSFMNNNYLGNTKDLKDAMEQVLNVFYINY